jgi:hypothetical protein
VYCPPSWWLPIDVQYRLARNVVWRPTRYSLSVFPKIRFACMVCRKVLFNCPRIRKESRRKTPSLMCANFTRYTVDLVQYGLDGMFSMAHRALTNLRVIAVTLEDLLGSRVVICRWNVLPSMDELKFNRKRPSWGEPLYRFRLCLLLLVAGDSARYVSGRQ